MIKNPAVSGRSNRAFLMLALVLGLVSAGLVAVFLSQAQGDGSGTTSTDASTVPVVVATQDIPAMARITPEMLEVRLLPSAVVLTGAFETADPVIGYVAVTRIVAGEQIIPQRVAETTEAGSIVRADRLSQIVPIQKESQPCDIQQCGLRALTIGISPVTAAAGLVRPGDRVDVVATFGDGSATTVLVDIEVLAIDRQMESVTTVQSEDGEVRTTTGGSESSSVATATLALWPEEAQKVAAAEEMTGGNCGGSLRLMLRHAGQTGTFGAPEGRGECAEQFISLWGTP